MVDFTVQSAGKQVQDANVDSTQIRFDTHEILWEDGIPEQDRSSIDHPGVENSTEEGGSQRDSSASWTENDAVPDSIKGFAPDSVWENSPGSESPSRRYRTVL